MPVVRARCPPAEFPVTTMRDASKPYCSALLFTQCRAQRQSSTAAGAREMRPSRYCTLTTAQPFSSQGSNRRTLPSLLPPTQPPPWMYISTGVGPAASRGR